MQCAGGSAEDVEFIDVGWADFLSITEADQVDFAWIYYAWTGINAELQGIDLNIIMLKEYLECIPDYYTPILITSEAMIANDPDTVKAFVAATARGFEFAIDSPAEAADILLAANPDLGRRPGPCQPGMAGQRIPGRSRAMGHPDRRSLASLRRLPDRWRYHRVI